ncbi:MAG: hypothetical protein ACTHU0_03485 [Kofleriaceae bacterium]
MHPFVALICVACALGHSARALAESGEHAPARPAAGLDTDRISVGDPAAPGRVISAQIAAAVDDGAATDRPVRARAGQRIALYAVITIEHAGQRVVYSDAPRLELGRRRVEPRPLARAPRIAVRWNRVEPAVATMTNGDTPAEFRFAPIDYRTTPIDRAAGATSLVPDVHPTLIADHGGGIGTMRYQVVVHQSDRAIASPGPEARRGRGSGGLTDAVMRVSIRRDDSFLGYMTELYNQPYIWASAGITDATHQSERLEGSDCADLLVYGQRRLGNRLAYTWTGALPQVTTLLGAGTRGSDGVYRDARGKPLPFTQPGDVVLFPRHVGALAVDRGVIGVLDDQDLMMHTLFDSPKEQAIAESGYADTPVELRRFRRR